MLTSWAKLTFFSSLNSICYSYLITTIHLSNIFYSCNILSSFLHLMLPLQCNTTFCFILVLIERKKKLLKTLQKKSPADERLLQFYLSRSLSMHKMCEETQVSFTVCVLKISISILINVLSNLVLNVWRTANRFSWLLRLPPNFMNMIFKRRFSKVSKGQGCSFRQQCVERKEPRFCLLGGHEGTLTSGFAY